MFYKPILNAIRNNDFDKMKLPGTKTIYHVIIFVESTNSPCIVQLNEPTGNYICSNMVQNRRMHFVGTSWSCEPIRHQLNDTRVYTLFIKKSFIRELNYKHISLKIIILMRKLKIKGNTFLSLSFIFIPTCISVFLNYLLARQNNKI